MTKKSIVSLVVAIAICELAGAIGSVFTTPNIAGWYASLVRPNLAPPNWIFWPGVDGVVRAYGNRCLSCLEKWPVAA